MAVKIPKTILMVPAQPGYSLIEICVEEDNSLTPLFEPVLAWATDEEDIIHPVTFCQGVCNLRPSTIVAPDGTVHSNANDNPWPNVAAWLADGGNH